MESKEICIGIDKIYSNKQIIEKMKKFISSKRVKNEGKVIYLNVKYTQDEYVNYYTFKVYSELPLDNTSEYVRSTLENVLKNSKVKPFISSSKEIIKENVLTFKQFKNNN